MKDPKERYLDSHGHLSEEQLMRYQAGKMEEAEMHQIERHLLACSLCSEALEGFSLLEPGQAKPSIEDLKARLSQKLNSESQKTTPVYWKWGVAASVLLLFSASIFLVLNTLKQSHEEVVKKEIQIKPSPKLSNEKATNAHRPAIALKEQEVKADKVKQQKSKAEKPKDSTLVDAQSKAIAKKARKPAQAPPATDTTNLLALATEDISFMESVQIVSTNSMNRSISSGEIQSESFPSVITFNTPEEETVVIDTNMRLAETVKFDAKTVAARTIESKKEKKAVEISASLTGVSRATPVIGNANFKKYLKENILYPPEAKEEGVEGNVMVEFSVAPDSSLADFRIVEPLGYGLDEEAIRLIKEGPKWAPATINGTAIHQKVKVEVPFLLE